MIKEGQRLYYGNVVRIVADPRIQSEYWIVIKNDSKNAPEDSFSIYVMKDFNKGELCLSHFYPKKLMEIISSFDEKDLDFSEAKRESEFVNFNDVVNKPNKIIKKKHPVTDLDKDALEEIDDNNDPFTIEG